MKQTFVLCHPELSSSEITGWIEAANRKTSVVTRHGRQVGQVHPGGYRSQPSSHLSRVSDNWQFLDQTGLQAEGQRVVSGGSLEPGLGVPRATQFIPSPGAFVSPRYGHSSSGFCGFWCSPWCGCRCPHYPCLTRGPYPVGAPQPCDVLGTPLRELQRVCLGQGPRCVLTLGSFHLSVHLLLHSFQNVFPSSLFLGI